MESTHEDHCTYAWVLTACCTLLVDHYDRSVPPIYKSPMRNWKGDGFLQGFGACDLLQSSQAPKPTVFEDATRNTHLREFCDGFCISSPSVSVMDTSAVAIDQHAFSNPLHRSLLLQSLQPSDPKSAASVVQRVWRFSYKKGSTPGSNSCSLLPRSPANYGSVRNGMPESFECTIEHIGSKVSATSYVVVSTNLPRCLTMW